MENKKRNQKIITKPIKKSFKEDYQGNIIEIFPKMIKLRREIMLTLEIKLCQRRQRKVKRIFEKKEKIF